RDGFHGVAPGLPGGELQERLADRPLAERNDQAGFLRDRDEFGRRYPVAVVLPAHQRLDRPGPRAAHVEHRLVVERDLAALEGAMQGIVEVEPAPAGCRLAMHEAHDLVATVLLRLTQRGFGMG